MRVDSATSEPVVFCAAISRLRILVEAGLQNLMRNGANMLSENIRNIGSYFGQR